MRHFALFTAITVVGLATAAQASPYIISNAPPSINQANADYDGWGSASLFGGAASGSLSDGTIGGVGALRVDIDGSGAPQADIITVGAGANEMTGDWTGYFNPNAFAYYVGFSFYADTGDSAAAYPESLMVYFESGADVWTYDLTDAASSISTPGWYDFRAPFFPYGGAGGWTSPTASAWSEATFGTIDEIGIILGYQEGADQIYGISELGMGELPVPEPGTFMLLGSALLSLGMTFRKRIGSQARELISGTLA